MTTKDLNTRLRQCRSELMRRGQEHVLHWWDELREPERRRLLADIEAVPWSVVDALIPTHVLRQPARSEPSDLKPAIVHAARPEAEQAALYDQAVAIGTERLRVGRVAGFTVAGGQGSRLGFDGPKGCVPVTPVGDVTLFELFAQMVRAAGAKYGVTIPWYIMTSPANDADTRAYFERHGHFGLPAGDVMFFSQGMLPAFDFNGRLLLAERHRLALAPDGHGGSLKALATGGALADMQRRGVEVISDFQVDNPLVRPFDPLFIGLHATTQSEMSTKVTPKADDLERVGNLCLADGKVTVIEYSELPEHLAHARDASGARLFDAANLAVHLIDVAFVDRIVARRFELPFRRAEKRVPCVDLESGRRIEPDSPNAVKLESFVFDALPLANNPLLLEVDRREEFSPVKNASGVDSLETSHRDQVARACRWLEGAGVNVPRKDDGSPDVTVCITPSFALDGESIGEKAKDIAPLQPGQRLILE